MPAPRRVLGSVLACGAPGLPLLPRRLARPPTRQPAPMIAAALAAVALAVPAKAEIAATVGASAYQLDCTYSARGQQGLALPAYKGAPPEIYVRPWVCAAINRTVRHGWYGTTASGTTAMAVLILTHENVHLSAFPGARDEHATECQALSLMPAVLDALHAPAALLPQLLTWARQAHDALLALAPSVYGPAC